MDKKLTLSLDAEVIDFAKQYALEHQDSLSHLVEKYFRLLSSLRTVETGKIKNTDIDSITGIIDLPSDFDEKQSYREHRSRKTGL